MSSSDHNLKQLLRVMKAQIRTIETICGQPEGESTLVLPNNLVEAMKARIRKEPESDKYINVVSKDGTSLELVEKPVKKLEHVEETQSEPDQDGNKKGKK